jgi:hypothetical protein
MTAEQAEQVIWALKLIELNVALLLAIAVIAVMARRW